MAPTLEFIRLQMALDEDRTFLKEVKAARESRKKLLERHIKLRRMLRKIGIPADPLRVRATPKDLDIALQNIDGISSPMSDGDRETIIKIKEMYEADSKMLGEEIAMFERYLKYCIKMDWIPKAEEK